MSDVALARRVIAGDEAAFDEFFTAYFPRLYRFALARLGGNEDVSEEIVQRVLIRALDRLHTYKGEASLLTWLCTLCRREIAGWHGARGQGPGSLVLRRSSGDARRPRCAGGRRRGRSGVASSAA